MNMPRNIGYRPTWVEVKLDNLGYNFRKIRGLLSRRTKIMACVKADAYGHGLAPVAKKLASCGADYLAVASIDEGIILREEGLKLPVLILGAVLTSDIAPLFKYNITPTVCDLGFALALSRKAKALGKKINIHIKIDTGMGRIGVLYKDALEFLKSVHRLRSVNIEGIFTHLACADLNRDFTSYQIGLFNCLINRLGACGMRIPLVHAANSMGVIAYKESHFNMVRPGLIIYGLYPGEDLNIDLRPVLSLKTKVVYVKQAPKGYGISYGHTYILKKNSTIVTLPIGYGDGYPRNLSNIAPVLIRGKVFRVSGLICMDQIMVDVRHMAVKTGDEAVLIGTQGDNKITVEELSLLSGTIPYEIVCGLGSRVPRIYR